MKTAKKSTFSLMFYVKRTKPLKNGEVPICLRITVNRQYAEVMVKRSIPASLWDQKKECSKGKAYSDRELNHYLDSVKARVYQPFATNREQILASRLVLAFASNKVPHCSLFCSLPPNEKSCKHLICRTLPFFANILRGERGFGTCHAIAL